MSRPICYLFGAGERHGAPPLPNAADYVIAVDGGLAYAQAWGVAPNLLVGDFDSLPQAPINDPRTLVLPKEKDDTDMVAALREGWQRGYRMFHIYGGTGGRLDHTLANIQCVADLAVRGGRGYLFDRDTIITAIHNDRAAFAAGERGTVSAFAHSDTAIGVYERGLKYPLADATLRSTYPLGISNEFTGVPASIEVQRGTLILIYPLCVQEV